MPNPIPKVAIGWGIATLCRQVREIEQEVTALQILKDTDDLPEQMTMAYQALVDEIHVLGSTVNWLHDVAKQGGIPIDHA